MTIWTKIMSIVRHPASRGVWLGLFCALLAWYVGHRDVFRGLEDWMLDSCFSHRGVRPTKGHIIIVGIDEQSLEELGKPLAFASPELAEVVTYLKTQEVAAVGIDVYVSKSYSHLPELQPGRIGDAYALGQAIRSAGQVVVPKWRSQQRWMLPLSQWQPKEKADPTDIGFLNFMEDGDQFVRKARLVVPEEDAVHFGLAVYAKSQGADFQWNAERSELTVAGQSVVLEDQAALRINYVGPAGTFPTLPFHAVLAAAHSGRAMPELRGAIVLIGVTAWTEEDLQPVPYANNYAHYLPHKGSGLMGATEIHANIISTLLDRAYIRSPAWLNSLLFLLFVGALLGAAYARLNLVWGLLLMIIQYFTWKLLALLTFSYAGWRVEMVPMMLLGFLLYGSTFCLRWRSLRRTLGLVQSEPVAHAMEQDPRKLDLGGQESVVTVLFCDVRNFSTYGERHTAQEVVTMLNTYYTAIVPIIEAEKGTITTYIGDGIMVLFGAPVHHDDHALRAVRAAVAMVRCVREMTEIWAKLDCSEFRIGVGIHTGKAVVGSVGSPQRLNYTAIGDTVNAASRIEAENKQFGSEILISAATYATLSPEEREQWHCASQPMATTVKGKQEELFLHAVEVKDELPQPREERTAAV